MAEEGLDAYLTAARTRVDAVLADWSERGKAFWPAPVAGAVQYSLLGTGKRLRPTLVFAAAEAVGGAGPAVAELAAAIEVVHAYSLVHDDLPCMDDDDLRRGRATTHRAFDVPTATRAGLHMVALAARVLDHGLARLDLSDARRRDIALELFRAAGAGGMIGGQWADLEAEGRAIPVPALADVHRRKTGALITASCVIGALAAGERASVGHVAALRAYGEAIGLAFQIADDVLDATATSAQLGKTAGKDAAHAKSTFATLLGVRAAQIEAERLATEAIARLREAGLVSRTLTDLAHYIVTRQH